jgi:two-component system, LytTR family, sensor kinase
MLPFCTGWFVWICVHQLALYYMGVDWFTALTDSIVSNTLLIFIAMLLITLLRFYLPRVNSFLVLFVWVATLTAGWFFAVNYALNYLSSTIAAGMAGKSSSWFFNQQHQQCYWLCLF